MSRWSEKSFDRRGFLKVGTVAGLGMSLADFFAIESAQAAKNSFVTPKVRAKSVIHIFLQGGVSAQESWDPETAVADRISGRIAGDQHQAARRPV